jgi:hypothetical protein
MTAPFLPPSNPPISAPAAAPPPMAPTFSPVDNLPPNDCAFAVVIMADIKTKPKTIAQILVLVNISIPPFSRLQAPLVTDNRNARASGQCSADILQVWQLGLLRFKARMLSFRSTTDLVWRSNHCVLGRGCVDITILQHAVACYYGPQKSAALPSFSSFNNPIESSTESNATLSRKGFGECK